MTTENSKKIKLLLSLFDENKLLFSHFLLQYGFSSDLLQWYRKTGWIESYARGLYKKVNVTVSLDDLILAMQKQLNLNIFFGGKFCLRKYYGINHFSILGESKKNLFYNKSERKLPIWFKSLFKDEIIFVETNFLENNIGFNEINGIFVSTPERAFLEVLYMVPKETTVSEAEEILELLPNLRPKLLENLLKKCSSIKVKRLFLYLAEKVNHSWFKYIKTEIIDLGDGIREIEKNGKYVEKYKIVVKDSKI